MIFLSENVIVGRTASRRSRTRSMAPVESSTAKWQASGGDGGKVTRALNEKCTPGVGRRNVAETRLDTQSTDVDGAACAAPATSDAAKTRPTARIGTEM